MLVVSIATNIITLIIMIDIENFSKSDKLFDGHYQLLRPLSTDGGTADVWLAIDVNTVDVSVDEEEKTTEQDTGMLVAIKIYRPKNALDIDGEQRFRDEYKIVYECRHENLLQPTNFSIFEGIPYLVLPYCKYGSSEQLIGKKLTSADIWKFILDVSSGLNRLHTNDPSIIHQDIKPANILIDNSKDYTTVLTTTIMTMVIAERWLTWLLKDFKRVQSQCAKAIFGHSVLHYMKF